MARARTPGYFGKLAGAGDFVQRRLPPAFVDAWDRGFSRAIAESRDLLGADWGAAYRASPAWRFLLSPGICGAGAWGGVVGPATDRVGRCFPMAIAAPLEADAPGLLYDGERWFEAAERTLRDAHDRRLGADGFDQRVAALALPPDPDAPTLPALPAGIDRARRDYWLPLPARAGLPRALWSHLAPAGCALWWSARAGRLRVGRGLPAAETYAGFLAAPAMAAAGGAA
ncbi:type VI secretion system-associated protein TagF [Luteimonas huabeiensis]|uniref:type VI secretion system-associated protein TagF n=1 Tax=Luteimonas huabeiensis TaxID=1244513 RepID=UPI000465D67B|nr:type VI secretion system-associated protein TagF [Luteimonas huabeiensis]